MDAIRGPSPNYKREAVDALVVNAEAVTPQLLALLDDILDDAPAAIARIGGDFDALYALVVLAYLRCEAAHERFVALARLPRDPFEALVSGFLTEGFSAALVLTCGRDLSAVRDLLRDAAVHEYLRAQAADAMVLAVHEGWAERGEVLDELAALLARGDLAEPGSYVWTGIGHAMLHLQPREHVDALEAALEDGRIEAIAFGRADIARSLSTDDEMADRLRTFHSLRDDVHAWLSWWACFEENEELWRQRTESLRKRMLKHQSAEAAEAKRALKQRRKRQRAARRKSRGSRKRG